ncbi:zinc finger protein 740-like isoform X3 [Malaya genurostris]|uniref:zinc finger protein 740-like isoform X3 n=1 Tax=Malaya genurostris TaxID=325434 RepID=UPI0026F39A82|nr:zinc finger protein 740-like isoform X3 [Malaya genurostris]
MLSNLCLQENIDAVEQKASEFDRCNGTVQCETDSCHLRDDVLIKEEIELSSVLTINSSNQNKCQLCDKHFVSKHNLKRHNLLHDRNRCFSCDICEKILFSKSHLITHMVVHAGDKPYKCETCDVGLELSF